MSLIESDLKSMGLIQEVEPAEVWLFYDKEKDICLKTVRGKVMDRLRTGYFYPVWDLGIELFRRKFPGGKPDGLGGVIKESEYRDGLVGLGVSAKEIVAVADSLQGRFDERQASQRLPYSRMCVIGPAVATDQRTGGWSLVPNNLFLWDNIQFLEPGTADSDKKGRPILPYMPTEDLLIGGYRFYFNRKWFRLADIAH